MNLTRWRNKLPERAEQETTQAPIARFRREMDDLFNRFMSDPWSMDLTKWQGMTGWAPRIDMSETDSEIRVHAELPGIDPKEIDISVEGDLLTLRGDKRQEHEEKQRDYHYVERQYGTFQRTVQLPTSADPNKVDANYRDGVLTLTIAKRPEAKPRRIEVKS